MQVVQHLRQLHPPLVVSGEIAVDAGYLQHDQLPIAKNQEAATARAFYLDPIIPDDGGQATATRAADLTVLEIDGSVDLLGEGSDFLATTTRYTNPRYCLL